jgi:hypothetical protein
MFKPELLTQILMPVPEEHDVYIYFENSKCLVGFLKLIIFKKYLKLISEVLTLNQRLEIRHLIISFFILRNDISNNPSFILFFRGYNIAL